MEIVKLLFKGKILIANYFFYSVIVTLFDTAIVWTLVRFSSLTLVAANTTGAVTGFLLHYVLASKSVFKSEYGVAGFILYLATFLFGLGFANWLIVMSYEHVFHTFVLDLRILMSKGVSIAIPFFALYYIRKYLFSLLNRKMR